MMNSSTCAIFSSVRSIRVPLGAPGVHLEGPGVHVGIELAAHDRPQDGEHHHQRPEPDTDRQEPVPEDHRQPTRVDREHPVDHLLPAGERPGHRPRPPAPGVAVEAVLRGGGVLGLVVAMARDRGRGRDRGR